MLTEIIKKLEKHVNEQDVHVATAEKIKEHLRISGSSIEKEQFSARYLATSTIKIERAPFNLVEIKYYAIISGTVTLFYSEDSSSTRKAERSDILDVIRSTKRLAIQLAQGAHYKIEGGGYSGGGFSPVIGIELKGSEKELAPELEAIRETYGKPKFDKDNIEKYKK